MNSSLFQIVSNDAIAKNTYRLEILGDAKALKGPGQFINIRIDGMFLRRPISVCTSDRKERITVIYKTVGKGTEALSRMKPGDKLDVLTGLGNGYDLSSSGDKPLLIGGGAGVPPLFWLAEELVKDGKTVRAVLGFNTKEEVFLADDFERLGCEVTVVTVDGSLGRKGFVTDYILRPYTYFYCCGPEPMLKAVYRTVSGSGEFSFEERMGCGFGACMGCSCRTVTGYKRICREGPVLKKEEILWKE